MHQPMGSGSVQTDLQTGLPEELLSQVKQFEKAQDKIIEGDQTKEALHQEDGRVLVKFVYTQLEVRLNQFMAQDPICLTLLNLLTELNFTANIGKKQAIRNIKSILGENAPDWLNHLA